MCSIYCSKIPRPKQALNSSNPFFFAYLKAGPGRTEIVVTIGAEITYVLSAHHSLALDSARCSVNPSFFDRLSSGPRPEIPTDLELSARTWYYVEEIG